jgi:hypothetical protein
MLKHSWTGGKRILPGLFVATIALPAHAAVFSIDDGRADNRLLLRVAWPNTNTQPGDGNQPGVGNLVKIDTPLSAADQRANYASYNVTSITYDRLAETLKFTFVSRTTTWSADTYKYRYFTDANGNSDLFVIQGLRGSYSDFIEFYSAPPGAGLPTNMQPPTDIAPRVISSTATPTMLQTTAETGDWQLA